MDKYEGYIEGRETGFSEFRWQLLQKWHRAGTKTGHADPPVIRKFQQYSYMKIGRQAYTTLAGDDCMGFSNVDTVRHHLQDDRKSGKLMPKYVVGINHDVIQQFAPRRFGNTWVASCGDGTRGKRALERVGDELLGEEFNPDVAQWEDTKCFVPRTKSELLEMASIIRRLQKLSAEIYTEHLRGTTSREAASLTVAIIPEASKGSTGFGTLQYWFKLLDAYRKGYQQVKSFVTDNCSVGLSAGQLLMTPNEEMLNLGCSYLGLPCDDYPFFDVYCQPVHSWVGSGYACTWTPLPVSWETDNAHLLRLGRNLLSHLSFIVFFCIKRGTLRGSKVASFDYLRKMAQNRCAPGMRLTEITTISGYAEFKNDAAYKLVSMDVIHLLQRHHPEDTATLLALESLHFNAEAHRNPNFSNAFLMVEYVWRAAAVWEMQERYMKEVSKVDRPSDCIPSHQFRKAIVLSACTATNYALCYFLEGRPFDEFNLAELNSDDLEGVHSAGRHMVGKQGGANQANFTTAGWTQIQDTLQAMADTKRYCENEGGVKFGAPRHTEQTHQRKFSLGHHGDDDDDAKSFRRYRPPDTFQEFMEDLVIAREAAYAWARARFEELFGPSYVDQCRDANQWEERIDVPSRDTWLSCKRVRTGTSKDEAALDPKAAATLRVRDVVELPGNMQLVLTGKGDIRVPGHSLLGKLVVPVKVKQRYEQLEEELAVQAKQAAADVAADVGANEVDQQQIADSDEAAVSLVDRLQVLKKAAAEFRKDLGELKTSLASSKWKFGQVKSENDQVQLAKVMEGSAVLDEETGQYQSTDQLMTKYFRADKVDRDRCRRFIKYVLRDWKAAMKEGHDVTLGSCLLAQWGGKDTFAVLRVLKMYEGNDQVFSLRFNKKCRKQQYRVELLAPVGHTETGSQRYRSSGWQVGPIGSPLVMEKVDLLPMVDVEGVSREQRMHDALLPVERVMHLRKRGYKQVAIDCEGTIAALAASRDGKTLKVDKLSGWSFTMRCYWCKTCWYDHTTGGLMKCSKCCRAYHQHCASPARPNEQDASSWECPVCTGEDPNVCKVCSEPFSEKEVEDPASYENNELVRCGSCNGWWHQACHIPSIYPLHIGEWKCSTCSVGCSAAFGGAAAAATQARRRRRPAAARPAAAAHGSAASAALAAVATQTIGVGSFVEARHEGGRRWYPATVSTVNADGSYDLAYDDGDHEDGVARCDQDGEEVVRVNVKKVMMAAAASAAAAAAAGEPAAGEANQGGRSRRFTGQYGVGVADEDRHMPDWRQMQGRDSQRTRNDSLTWDQRRW